jgi:predicted phage terminase large subunit-like protein
MLDHGGCDHLNLPAIAEEDMAIPLTRGRIWQRKKGEVLDPVRIPLVFLEEQRLAMGFRGFGAQFQQNPTVADGGQIDLAWFGQYDSVLPRRSYHRIVQSWDTAATDRQNADFSVGLTWGWREDRWHLLDVVRAQLRFVALRERVIAWHRQWQADALIIENASTGLALYDEVRQAALPGLLRCPTPRGSKLDRLAGRTAQLATGDYLLPTSAPWLQAFRNELTAFPDGRNDDQVDALVQFLEFVSNEDRWVRTRYSADGRPVRPSRPDRRPRYYGGDAPSGASCL